MCWAACFSPDFRIIWGVSLICFKRWLQQLYKCDPELSWPLLWPAPWLAEHTATWSWKPLCLKTEPQEKSLCRLALVQGMGWRGKKAMPLPALTADRTAAWHLLRTPWASRVSRGLCLAPGAACSACPPRCSSLVPGFCWCGDCRTGCAQQHRIIIQDQINGCWNPNTYLSGSRYS